MDSFFPPAPSSELPPLFPPLFVVFPPQAAKENTMHAVKIRDNHFFAIT